MMNTNEQTYFSEILLVTDPALYPILAKTLMLAHPLATPKTLMLAKPIVRICPFQTLSDLEAYCEGDLSDTRLISCGTDVIVPQSILNKLPYPSYNIHPGLPDYPGLYPSVFAIYDNAENFGTTVHELVAQVDSGPIVAVDRFPIPKDADRAGLEMLSLQSVLNIIEALTPEFMTKGALSHIDAKWTGTTKCKADFDALCQLPSDVTAEEFHRRWRSVGEGPNHALEISLFGHRFRLDNNREGSVTIAGQEAMCFQTESSSI